MSDEVKLVGVLPDKPIPDRGIVLVSDEDWELTLISHTPWLSNGVMRDSDAEVWSQYGPPTN